MFPSQLKRSNPHMPVQTPFHCSVSHNKILGFSTELCVLSKMQESLGLYVIKSFTQSDWVNEFFPGNLDNFLCVDKIPGFLLSVYQGKLHKVFQKSLPSSPPSINLGLTNTSIHLS